MLNNKKQFLKIAGTGILLCAIFFQSCDNTAKNQQYEHADAEKMSVIIDDPDITDNLEIADLNRRRVIQLRDGAAEGTAEQYFWGETARYDIEVYYITESKGEQFLQLHINDNQAGEVVFNENKDMNGSSGIIKEKKISDVDVQKYSKILLKFNANEGTKCRIEKIVFIPKGPFEGKSLDLAKPKTLKIFETPAEQTTGRNMLTDFVKVHLDSIMKERTDELSSLKTPIEWSVRQKKTREHLEQFFGKFPGKTPLNARLVGKIEHERYTIEKIIYESQPQYYVAANLYLPKDRKFPVPGIVFPCGHSDDGKTAVLYHETALGLVLKGYVVLVVDPMGQGERSEYNDTATNNPLVHKSVSQHHYISRPSFLLNQTLSGLRLWDCIRAVDYLVSRPEVDTSKLAAVGNSGGGQMSLLITAIDKRIKVCAAGHPGGSMENTYLTGQTTTDRDILSLIPPRPLRIIVGDSSGEERNHRAKLNDMQLFYEGLGYEKNRGELVLVKGVHDMKQPKREAAYEWLNKWFDRESEGKAEAILEPEKMENLWCTPSGSTLISLGGETGQTLNVKRLKNIYRFSNNSQDLKNRIAQRIKLEILDNKDIPTSKTIETVSYRDLSIEKFTYQSESGITIPSLLIKPKNVKSDSPGFLFVSDKGKPKVFEDTLMPFKLANAGFIVFAIDVRGTGETNPTATLPLTDKYSSYTPIQWKHDVLAIQSPAFGRTMAGMRVFDMVRGIDFISSRDDLKGRKIIAVGEGLGGLWASLVSVFDSRVAGTVTISTLPSYKPLITNKYYHVNAGYFWLPGALVDFDITDLIRLASPKPGIWIDPVNALSNRLDQATASSLIKPEKNLYVITPDKKPVQDILKLLETTFK